MGTENRMMRRIRRIVGILRLYYRPILLEYWGIGKIVASSKTIWFMLKNHHSVELLHCYDFLRTSLTEAPANGMILEFGVSSGGTIRTISEAVPDRLVYGFDSFDGLPEPWGPLMKGQFKQSELPNVPSNVVLVIGLFQDTLEDFLKVHTEDIAFVHMDADIYSSTKYVLFTLGKYNRIIPGMVIQFNEFISINYPKAWVEGEYGAFKDFVEQFGVTFEYVRISYGNVSVRILGIEGWKG